jgi:hypothetical protein
MISGIAMENGHTGISIKEIEPTIEDSFIRLMKQTGRSDVRESIEENV